MAFNYRVISFHRKPAQESPSQFLANMAQIESALSQKQWSARHPCLAWHAFTPITNSDEPQPPSADWINTYDFKNLNEAKAWTHHLTTQSSACNHHLWFLGISQRFTVKKPAPLAGTAPLVTVIRFAKKKPELSRSQFYDYWLNTHGPIASQSPFLAKYEQLHLTQPIFPTDTGPWEGFTLSHFNSLTDLSQHAQHPAGRAAAADTQHFLHAELQPSIIVQKQNQLFFNY